MSSSKPPGGGGEPAAPRSATPIVVAVLGLSGVLGSALLANWDKVFGPQHRVAAPATPAASAAAGNSGAQSPVLSGVSGPVTINYGTPASGTVDAKALTARLQGVWLSPVALHPYQPGRRFRLRLELRPFGGEMGGQVSDIAEGQDTGPVFELSALKPVEQGLDFQVESSWCCEGGQQRPYQVFYTLRPQGDSLAVTRRNNAPGGGQVERFVLTRR